MGADKVSRCSIFVGRRTWQLPFPVEEQPTAEMLRNNCYGIEVPPPDLGLLLDHLRSVEWRCYVDQAVNSSFNVTKKDLLVLLEDVGVEAS